MFNKIKTYIKSIDVELALTIIFVIGVVAVVIGLPTLFSKGLDTSEKLFLLQVDQALERAKDELL
jgi:hypothetical protein